MKNDTFTCCFTGYRPQQLPFSVSRDDKAYIDFENRLIAEITELINAGCGTFISGMAAGFDIIAAECVTEIRELITDTSVELVCAIPFPDQAKSFPPFWKQKYCDLLARCERSVTVCEEYSPACYMKRNIYMVDNSDIALAFWDGKPGGTKNTVDYAKRKGRKIINLYEQSGE